MAVKIRLRRMGQKKAPFYRIIVADSAQKWLSTGAQPTEIVSRLFKNAGIIK